MNSWFEIENFENHEKYVKTFRKPFSFIFCAISSNLCGVFPSFEFFA